MLEALATGGRRGPGLIRRDLTAAQLMPVSISQIELRFQLRRDPRHSRTAVRISDVIRGMGQRLPAIAEPLHRAHAVRAFGQVEHFAHDHSLKLGCGLCLLAHWSFTHALGTHQSASWSPKSI